MPNERSVKLPREWQPANVEIEEDDLVPLLNFIEQEELLRAELMECVDETVRRWEGKELATNAKGAKPCSEWLPRPARPE